MAAAPDQPISLALRTEAGAKRSPQPSPLETEVVNLFDQLRERVLRYLLSLGVPVSDGEEIVQEVFLALFEHLRQGRSRENLRGWVFSVAHNLGLKRRQRMWRDGRSLNTTAEAQAVQLLADPSPDPEVQAASRQKQRRLRAVVEVLPEQDRQCLFLRAEGLRYREIATVLDVSLGTVASSLAKSLARLARAAER
ncbi:MAG TPA: RNA polymerase sigma factor [Bryobacteraceae bacterium]|jgi:RNA polymerase sigma-70 factor (ECF subfamily)